MKQLVIKFWQSQQAAFSVIGIIVLTLLLGIVSLVITISSSVLDRNRLQASADLAVISARVAYRQQLNDGNSETVAYEKAQKVMETIFASNRGLSADSNASPSMTKGPDGFTISQTGNTDIFLNGGLTEDNALDYSVIARSFDSIITTTKTTTITDSLKTALELSVVIDTSSSMGQSFLSSSDWIYESIATGAIKTISNAFQGDITRDDTAVGVVHFHDNVIVNQPLTNNRITATNAVIWPWHGGYAGATNIYVALEAATKQIENFTQFDGDKYSAINEVIILLSDGRQSTKFGYSLAQVEQLCTDFKNGGDAKHKRYIFGLFAKNAKFGLDDGTVEGVKFVKDCSSGGGYHFSVDNKTKTEKALDDIVAKIDKHTKTTPVVSNSGHEGVRLTK